ERAVDDFLRRVEREETPGDVDGALPPAGADLRGEQLAEDADADAPVAEALGGEPLVVALDGADEAFQEVAAIELGGLAQRRDRAVLVELEEAKRVDVDDGGVEAERRAVALEQPRREEAKGVVEVAREERGVVAEEGLEVAQRRLGVEVERHPDDGRLRAAAADRQRVAAMVDGRELAEKTDRQQLHQFSYRTAIRVARFRGN